MKNTIYLPTLKKVKIVNYSLYNKDIEYDFIEGVNLIIGGNGVGKTTFINIVKYALIGLYKNDLTVRNYNNEKRFTREVYTNCNTYFRNRTKEEATDKDGYVELFFDIKDTAFTVRRSLYNTELLSATYTENGKVYCIEGEAIKQDKYARYENSSDEEKEKYLQFNYEEKVRKKANLSDFNDFIFFINQILLFDEARKNVLWSEEAQDRLHSNYLNNPELETKRKELNFEAKYQDSIARHRQEEIKAINRVVKRIDAENNSQNAGKDKKLELVEKIETLEKNLVNMQSSRNEIQKEVSRLYKKVSDISSSINEKEKLKEKEESKQDKEYWIGVNPKYNIYKKQIFSNQLCPMCNSIIGEDENNLFNNEDKCFLCHSYLVQTKEDSELIKQLRIEINSLSEERKKNEVFIVAQEGELKILDSEVRKIKVDLFKNRTQLRAIEDAEESKNDKAKEESSYIAMMERLEELSMEKERASILSEKCREEGKEIVKRIEEDLIKSTKSISSIFENFAEAFLHVPCFLTFDLPGNAKSKRFIPVIDGKLRFDEDELSESQRFFVDYSFRMSILGYFYECPTFYICETPDSSLDISYEENAANTLLKYIERPNSLILTSNLNNSTFIKAILNRTKRVSVLNLLRYGKASKVQKQHLALQELAKEIEEIIYGQT